MSPLVPDVPGQDFLIPVYGPFDEVIADLARIQDIMKNTVPNTFFHVMTHSPDCTVEVPDCLEIQLTH